MKIEYTKEYNIWDTLYYLNGNIVKEAVIVGIHVGMDTNEDNITKINCKYKVKHASGVTHTYSDNELKNKFFNTKIDIIKHIADQL